MPRIVTKPFQLNTTAGLVAYKTGETVAEAHEAHWYAVAHSEERKATARSKKAEKAVADARAAYEAAVEAAAQAEAAANAEGADEKTLADAIAAREAANAAKAALEAAEQE